MIISQKPNRELSAGKIFEINYTNPAGNHMFKVNNRNTRTRCEICSKLTCSGVSIVNFKQVCAGWET